MKRSSSKSDSSEKENYNSSRDPRRHQQTHTKPLATCILVIPLHVKPLVFVLLSTLPTQPCCVSFLNLSLFYFPNSFGVALCTCPALTTAATLILLLGSTFALPVKVDIYSLRSIHLSSLPCNPEACVPQLILSYSKFRS